MLAFLQILFLQAYAAAAASSFKGPQSIDELVTLAFPKGGAPSFVELPSTPQVAIASNDTATLKIMDLKISNLPLKPGYNTFHLHHLLTKDLPPKSTIELVSFVGHEKGYQGSVDLCPYLGFANLHCPITAYKRDTVMKQVLQVPDQAEAGRFSFVAKVVNPDGSLVAHIAAIIDIVQEGPDSEKAHDEL